MIEQATLADLPAFKIGHAQDAEALTGCTAIVAPDGAACGVDVRGGGPATRETDLLRPENMVQQVHAVALSGGSAFGLEASCGVMEELAARGIGFEIAGTHVPIVTGACLFDLPIGKPKHPDKAMGRAACVAAFEGSNEEASAQGNVGAGCGATVGKFAAPTQAMKSGLGWHALRLGDVVVAAVVAVNALGCVRDAQGRWIAGVQDGKGGVVEPIEVLAQVAAAATSAQARGESAAAAQARGESAAAAQASGESTSATQPTSAPCTNTTIGCVLTNAALTKAQCTKVASVTHDAYARAIKPVHTQNDGDAIFCMASGEVVADQDFVGVLANEAMQQAIVNAVMHADGLPGLPAAKDLLS